MSAAAARIIVEGGIGVGKSTALKHVSLLKPDWAVVQEPVEKFEVGTLASGARKYFLKEFYDCPSSLNFRHLQVCAL